MTEERFNLIKQKYDEYQRELLKQGRLPLKDTGEGFWDSALSEEVFELFKNIKLQNFRHFLDIGSGDGRVVLIAALFTKATGVEIDDELFRKSVEMQKLLNIKNVDFIKDNYFNHDFTKHDIIFCNPDKPMYRGLESKLLKELNGTLVMYGPLFHPQQLKKRKTFDIKGTLVSIYSR